MYFLLSTLPMRSKAHCPEVLALVIADFAASGTAARVSYTVPRAALHLCTDIFQGPTAIQCLRWQRPGL